MYKSIKKKKKSIINILEVQCVPYKLIIIAGRMLLLLLFWNQNKMDCPPHLRRRIANYVCMLGQSAPN